MFALLGIGVMTVLFILLILVFRYYYKLYRLVEYSEIWKYWKYQLIGFVIAGGGLLVSFYFYVLYIFSMPTEALRVSADVFHLILIYCGALIGVISSLVTLVGMQEFYNKAEQMSKKDDQGDV